MHYVIYILKLERYQLRRLLQKGADRQTIKDQIRQINKTIKLITKDQNTEETTV